mgnify:CR=1 FL=1
MIKVEDDRYELLKRKYEFDPIIGDYDHEIKHKIYTKEDYEGEWEEMKDIKTRGRAEEKTIEALRKLEKTETKHDVLARLVNKKLDSDKYKDSPLRVFNFNSPTTVTVGKKDGSAFRKAPIIGVGSIKLKSVYGGKRSPVFIFEEGEEIFLDKKYKDWNVELMHKQATEVLDGFTEFIDELLDDGFNDTLEGINKEKKKEMRDEIKIRKENEKIIESKREQEIRNKKLEHYGSW